MSSIKFTLWIIWIGILLAIGLVILLPLVALLGCPSAADAVARFSWAAVLGGPVLVIATNLLGWDRWLAGLGVTLTIGGFVALVARMKDRDDDSDTGAVV